MHWIGLAVTWLAIFTPPAQAHMGSSKYLRVEAGATGPLIVAEIDAVDVAFELGMPTDAPDPEALLASTDRVAAWLQRDLRVTAGGAPCPMTLSDAAIRERSGNPYVSLRLHYSCPSEGSLVLTDDAVFTDDPRHQSFVRIGPDESAVEEVLSRGHRSLPIDRPPSLVEQTSGFLVEGAMHLFTGFDHLLFLLSLLLVAGQRVRPEGWRKTLRAVAIIVTGFTLGHSVTLIAAALDWVTLPAKWVEVAIALSIAVVAVDNIVRPSPDRRQVLPVVAVVFGLVHGFGFSNVLRELSLPAAHRVAALLSFNVGIELAQLLFVAIVLVPLGFLAKRSWYRRAVVQGGSGLITLLALYWVVERVLG